MRIRGALQPRALPLLVILVVIVVQALYGQFAGNGRPLLLMWPTLALLAPALWWLVEGNAKSSIVAAVIMGALMFGSNHLGSLLPSGYVAAFWLGLPITTVIAWYVGKPKAVALPKEVASNDG
jgi:hypothetical protein